MTQYQPFPRVTEGLQAPRTATLAGWGCFCGAGFPRLSQNAQFGGDRNTNDPHPIPLPKGEGTEMRLPTSPSPSGRGRGRRRLNPCRPQSWHDLDLLPSFETACSNLPSLAFRIGRLVSLPHHPLTFPRIMSTPLVTECSQPPSPTRHT